MAHKSDSFNIIVDFKARVKRQYRLHVCKIRLDNERSLINLPNQRPSDFQTWATDQGIDLEVPPLYTKEPTGGAERPGGIIGSKARTMIISANLPQDLWPEAWGAAAYLHNRSPRQGHGWRSPLKVFEKWFYNHFRWWQPLNNVNITAEDIATRLQPSWSGIYAYSLQAYPLETAFKAGKLRRHFKVNPQAYIGYLVGYRASNLYRIWVPALQEVITARDVRFDETEFFDPKEEVKDPVTITEYRPMAEILAVPDIIPEFDLDVGDLISINKAAESHTDLQVPTFAYSQGDNLAGSRLPAVASPASATTGSQNSGVVVKETIDTLLGLPTPEPESILLPVSPVVDPGHWTGEVLSPSHGKDDAQVGDTIVVNTGLSDKDLLPLVPEETAVDPDFLPAGSGNDLVGDDATGDAHSGADPGEMTPIAGAGPAVGPSQRRQRRRAVEIYGTEPTRQSTRPTRPSTRHPPSSASWLLELGHCKEDIPLHTVFAAAVQGDHRPHRDQLVKVPKYYRDLHKHLYRMQFKEACRVELCNLLRKRTWTLICRETVNMQILPLKWVFTYKFDEDGYLLKCKARIYIRGDL